MINLKVGGILLAAFIAGAFVASPELRAYAANTVGSTDIINESILSEDIKNGQVRSVDIADGQVTNVDIFNNAVTTTKIASGAVMTSDISDTNGVKSVDIVNGEVKSADIATDAVGADEIAGVTNLVFGQFSLTDETSHPHGDGISVFEFPGAVVGDNAVATMNSGSTCFDVHQARPLNDRIQLYLINDCPTDEILGTANVGIIVFDNP